MMRYALYFAPGFDAELHRLANDWLGRDAKTGAALAQPEVEGFSVEDFSALTDEPRRYGFHATLKAPFELAEGRTESELVAAFLEFAQTRPAFTLPKVVLGQLGSFFALVPQERNETLQDLAIACVEQFEPFRAPLSETDFLRRKPEKLTPTERYNLETWGYPYVFEQFQFHMTLTGQVLEELRPAMQKAAQSHFSGILDRPLSIDHLALFAEEERGAPFKIHTIVPLG
jgi:putative phosphonate metabolism protein